MVLTNGMGFAILCRLMGKMVEIIIDLRRPLAGAPMCRGIGYLPTLCPAHGRNRTLLSRLATLCVGSWVVGIDFVGLL